MRTKLMGAALVAALTLLIIVAASATRRVEQPPAIATPDLSDHSLYRTYNFGEDASVIDVGIQPLWLPTGTIAEAMMRDDILRKNLSDQGLEIRFHPFLKGADVNFFLRRGDLEVAIGGDMPALTAAAESNVVIAALIQQGFSAIVAGRPMLIRELKGRRIGYAFGSNAHYALLQTLAAADLGETDVRLVPLDVKDMPQALNNGQIDAFSAWEPTPTIATTRFEEPVVIHRSLTSGYLYFSRSFAERQPQAVYHIVAAELRAITWMRREDQNLHQASCWALQTEESFTGQRPVLSVEEYAALAESDLLGTAPVPFLPGEDLTTGGRLFQEFSFLQGLGMIPASTTWEEVSASFDPTIIEEVLQKPQTYQLESFAYADEEKEANGTDTE